MNKILIYDNTLLAPQDISSLLGVHRFSDVYYRKRSLERWVINIAAQAGIQFFRLEDRASREAILSLASNSNVGLTVIYVPACMAFGCSEQDAVLFLQKLALTRNHLRVSGSDDAPSELPKLAVMVDGLARNFLQTVGSGGEPTSFLKDAVDNLHAVPDDVGVIDLRDPLYFTDYLTSNFDVRFFNSVQTVNNFVVLKRSTEVEKLRREHRYYSLLPPHMQMFFVQPFDFQLESGAASYKMERLFVPDMALQWIHGSFSQLHFERFLDKVFFFLNARPQRVVSREQAKKARGDAYQGKLRTRLDQLLAHPAFMAVKPYADASFGGVEALWKRYQALYDKLAPAPQEANLCIGHGDLCFSNILYSKTTGLMRFIDPRGADGDEDLYANPYYDIAKLSHSVLGNYDFINYGLYRLEVGKNLRTELVINAPPPAWAARAFLSKLAEAGFDPVLTRLYEASLFLSMLPLHIDDPKKVVAFLMNADNILGQLEQKH